MLGVKLRHLFICNWQHLLELNFRDHSSLKHYLCYKYMIDKSPNQKSYNEMISNRVTIHSFFERLHHEQLVMLIKVHNDIEIVVHDIIYKSHSFLDSYKLLTEEIMTSAVCSHQKERCFLGILYISSLIVGKLDEHILDTYIDKISIILFHLLRRHIVDSTCRCISKPFWNFKFMYLLFTFLFFLISAIFL